MHTVTTCRAPKFRSDVSVVQLPSPIFSFCCPISKPYLQFLLSNFQALISAKFCSKLGLRPTCDYYYEIYYCIPKWLASNRRVLVHHRQVMSHERIRSILWDYFLLVCLLQAILHNKDFSDQGYTALQSQYL